MNAKNKSVKYYVVLLVLFLINVSFANNGKKDIIYITYEASYGYLYCYHSFKTNAASHLSEKIDLNSIYLVYFECVMMPEHEKNMIDALVQNKVKISKIRKVYGNWYPKMFTYDEWKHDMKKLTQPTKNYIPTD